MPGGGGQNLSSRIAQDHTPQENSRAPKNSESPMVNLFGEDPEFKFDVGFQSEDLQLEQQQVSENKLETKVRKQFFRYTRKIEADIETITAMIQNLGHDEELLVMSCAFDSPSVVLGYRDRIRRIYVGTWAITPAGIAALQTLGETAADIYVLLDKTHSYKWIFQSGAYKLLQGKVHFKFTANHSKFMAIDLGDGEFLNVTGSMNLSNNPRWENMRINRSQEEFEFLKNFVETVGGDIL